MSSSTVVETLGKAFEFLSEAIMVIDADAKIQFINPAFSQEFDFKSTSLLDANISDVILPPENPHFFKTVASTLTVNGNWSGHVRLKTGTERGLSRYAQIDTLFSDAGEIECYVLRLNNRVEQPKNDQHLEELAYQDELTGLANRTFFNQLLKHEIHQCQRQANQFAVLFIDLDKFKYVNDTYGHEAGDILLCNVAERMLKTLRKSDVVARIGGDEFVVILNKILDSETVASVADKLVRELSKPFNLKIAEVTIGCSIGISIFPDNGTDAEHLMQHADVAMYRAKHEGGNSYFYFSEELNQELIDKQKLEQSIRQGLENGAFVPYFQPVVDQRTGNLVSVECLARWNHPSKGILNPIEFIPLANKAGLMHDILAQVLDGALAMISQWTQASALTVPLTVNITSKQFYQQKTFDKLAELLKKYALPSDAVRLEVTESTLHERGEELLSQLNKVQSAGFSITLDDFGTGYSSLKSLQQLPVDIIQIDRSFVRNLENNPHDRIIVKAIIQLAQTLGISAVAEGVETEKQREFLVENDCHIMQGFLFSTALSSDDMHQYLK